MSFTTSQCLRAMFQVVKSRAPGNNRRRAFQGVNIRELLYADGAQLVAKNSKQAQKVSRVIEQESEHLHVRPNTNKCSFMAFSSRHRICFANCEGMTKSTNPTPRRAHLNIEFQNFRNHADA